ncbi:restriction endonuclease subunit S [Luteococcus japonicus]|nr:restriction endonuclease subunit S [Luteococcus japonicus]
MTMHDGLVDQTTKFKKRVASEDTSSYKVIERGQLVIGFPIDEGVLDFQNLYPEAIVSPAYGVWNIRDSNTVHAPYLHKFLRSPEALTYYKSKLRGSTARRRSLPHEIFTAMTVPLPSLDEQRRIAAILDQADALRTKRRTQLAHLDALPQAIFHEMFSHVAAVRPLGEVLMDVQTGVSPKCEPRPAEPGEWGVLKLSAVTHGHFNPGENKAYMGDATVLQRVEVNRGDILMTRKNTPDLVGHVALVAEDCPALSIPDLIFRIRVCDEMNPVFFSTMMMNPRIRAQVKKLAGGAASSMSNISMARLRTLRVPCPPVRAQDAFAEIIGSVTTQRQQATRALSEIETLFSSLQSRAFRGEL